MPYYQFYGVVEGGETVEFHEKPNSISGVEEAP